MTLEEIAAEKANEVVQGWLSGISRGGIEYAHTRRLRDQIAGTLVNWEHGRHCDFQVTTPDGVTSCALAELGVTNITQARDFASLIRRIVMKLQLDLEDVIGELNAATKIAEKMDEHGI